MLDKKSIISIIVGIAALIFSLFSFIVVQLSFANVDEKLSNETTVIVWSVIAIVTGISGAALLYRKISFTILSGIIFAICLIPSFVKSSSLLNNNDEILKNELLNNLGSLFSLLGVVFALSLIVVFLVKFLHKDDTISPTSIPQEKKYSKDEKTSE